MGGQSTLTRRSYMVKLITTRDESEVEEEYEYYHNAVTILLLRGFLPLESGDQWYHNYTGSVALIERI